MAFFTCPRSGGSCPAIPVDRTQHQRGSHSCSSSEPRQVPRRYLLSPRLPNVLLTALPASFRSSRTTTSVFGLNAGLRLKYQALSLGPVLAVWPKRGCMSQSYAHSILKKPSVDEEPPSSVVIPCNPTIHVCRCRISFLMLYWGCGRCRNIHVTSCHKHRRDI